MPLLAVLAALGAALTWAAMAILAHGPARHLGAIPFTRIQLTAASVVMATMVSLNDGWTGLGRGDVALLGVSSLVGVVGANLAMGACLRRGGPRRTGLLLAMNAPIAALLSFLVLGERLSPALLLGGGLMTTGIVLAILFRDEQPNHHPLEALHAPLPTVIILGLAAAACQAVGLVAIKPLMADGLSPVTASALRVMGGAWALSVLTLAPLPSFEPLSRPSGGLILRAILPGLLGYVVASTLLLYAVRHGPTGIAASIGSAVPVLSLPILWAVTRQRPPILAWLGAILLVIGAVVISG